MMFLQVMAFLKKKSKIYNIYNFNILIIYVLHKRYGFYFFNFWLRFT